MRRLQLITDLPLRACTADFAAMSPTPGGRHCDSCRKTVHDLSALTRKAAEKFVADRSGQPTCYRYRVRHDGALVFAREPARPGLLALTLAACAPWGPPPEPAMDDIPAEYAAESVVIPARAAPLAPPLDDDPPDPTNTPPDPPDPQLAAREPIPSRPRTRHLPQPTPESEHLLTPTRPQQPAFATNREDHSHIMGVAF